MHAPTPNCPDAPTLERAAIDDDAFAAIRAHLSSCSACNDTLEQLRENNRFLGGFAVDGALPLVQPAPAAAGIEIPGYEIVREIHRGGQGVVYQALQRSTNRIVAIKVMKQGPFATLADRVRFEREIQTLGKLDHSNIVAVHDAGVSSGFHYFVMDYIEGTPLDEWMLIDRTTNVASADSPRARASLVLSLFIKVCEAVHAAHLRGIIHRDLKPSNIRVDADNEPHILDFGLAKSVGERRDTMMTRTGQFVGSLPWAAPEQVEGASDRIDLRSDVYSLGSILYQLLTGVLPFDVGSNLREAVDNILNRQPLRPSTVLSRSSAGGPAPGTPAAGWRSAIDDEVDTIVLKCLAKDPDRRYQSAGDIARDLRRYLAGDPIEAKRDSAMYVLRKTLRRYRVQATAAASFVVLLAVFAVVMSLLYRRSTLLERQAVDSAESLSTLLVQSNIEQGRMAGILGNLDQAERLLWSALLTRGGGRDGAPLVLNVPPGPPEAHWALWELYRRRPCLRTFSNTVGPTFASAVADDGTCLWLISNTGRLDRTDEFGRLIESTQLGLPEVGGLPMIFARGRVVTVQIRDRTAVFRAPSFDRPCLEIQSSPFSYAGELCISATGRRLASLLEGAVILYDLDAGNEIAQFHGDSAPLAAAAISDDDQLLSTRDREGNVSVWRIDDRQLIARLTADANRGPTRHVAGEMLFSPDGRLLADAWWDSPGRIWDISSQPTSVIALSESPGTYRCQAFSADGRLLAIGDGGGALHIFDSRSGSRISTMVAHRRRVLTAQFTGDARGVWTGDGSELRLWEVARDAGVRIPHIGNDQFHSVDFAPNGRWFAAAGGRGVLHRIDFASLEVTDTPLENEATISSVAISPDGLLIAAASYSNRVFLIRAVDSSTPPIQLAHPSRVSFACFSRDGSRLATACDDQVLRIWRTSDARLELESDPLGQRVPRIAFDPTGRRIAAAVRDGRLILWDLASNRFDTWASPSMLALRAVQFSDDGASLATAGADRLISIWDASAARLAATLPGHSQEIFCLDISSSGDLIASGDTGGAVRLWHGRLRRPLATLEGHTGSVMDVRFSPDDETLISVGLDGAIRVWNLNYYKRHIAGNVATQLQRLSADATDAPAADDWRNWAGQIEKSLLPSP